jgi:uncharacterized membrane protein
MVGKMLEHVGTSAGAAGGAQQQQQRERLRQAFTKLTSANGMVPATDRVNRKRFQKNMREFVIDVKGFLRAQ